MSDAEENDDAVLEEIAFQLGIRLLLACATARAAGFDTWKGFFHYVHPIGDQTSLSPEALLLRSILLDGPSLEHNPALHEPLLKFLGRYGERVWEQAS